MSYTPVDDIVLSGNPTAPTPAANDNDTSIATTAYVQTELADYALSSSLASYLALAGGTMTGDITLSSGVDVNFNDTNSGLQWSDVRLSRAAADVLQLDSGDQLRVLQDPVNDNDVARKSYVDTLVTTNTHRHAAVELATTGNITLSGEQTIDGTLTSGSRVLVKDQTTSSENGIYVSAAGAWSRATDFDSAAEIQGGDTTFVLGGSTNVNTTWTQTETVTTVGSDAILWVQTGSASVVNSISDLSDVDTAGAVDGALFRYDTGTSDWQDTSTLLYSDNGQLQVTNTGATAGILLGGDAQLYRDSANVLRTPDSLTVDADMIVSGSTGIQINSGGALFVNGGADADQSIALRNSTDTQVAWQIDNNGQMQWGSGTAVADVTLSRSAANILAMGSGDKIQQNAAPTVGDDLTNKTYVDAQVSGVSFDLNGLTDVDTSGVVDGALLRYESTGTTWADTSALLFDDAGQLQVTTVGASAGILLGGDAQLYRSNANELRTPDAFVVDGAVTASGKMTMAAGMNLETTTKTANYSVSLATDYIILADNSGDSADLIITLPASHSLGDTIIVKDAGGTAASGTFGILISPDAGDSIDGLSVGVDLALTIDYQSVTLVSDGTNWFLV